MPLPPQDRVTLCNQIENKDERRQEIGNLIYKSIQAAFGDENCGKITGMLLDEKVVNF